MRKHLVRTAAAAVALAASPAAFAAGDTGTGAVGEMQISGGQFLMMLGGLAGLGVVIWVVTKFVVK